MRVTSERSSGLTAQERHDLVTASLAQSVHKIKPLHITEETGIIADIVRTRFEVGREKRTGFALVVAEAVDVQRALLERRRMHVTSPDTTEMYKTIKASDQTTIIRVDEETWSQETGEDRYTNAAMTEAAIAVATDAPSGTMPAWILAQMELGLTEAELDYNIPGAVILGEKVFAVNGLYRFNNREVAEAIGLGCLMQVQDCKAQEQT